MHFYSHWIRLNSHTRKQTRKQNTCSPPTGHHRSIKVCKRRSSHPLSDYRAVRHPYYVLYFFIARRTIDLAKAFAQFSLPFTTLPIYLGLVLTLVASKQEVSGSIPVVLWSFCGVSAGYSGLCLPLARVKPDISDTAKKKDWGFDNQGGSVLCELWFYLTVQKHAAKWNEDTLPLASTNPCIDCGCARLKPG